jgi:hypothetical protein
MRTALLMSFCGVLACHSEDLPGTAAPAGTDGASCQNGLLDDDELCDDSAGVACPTEVDCQVKYGLCWRWTVEGEGCARRCVQGGGLCGEVLHPTDSNAFPVLCSEGCEDDASADGIAPWK